MKGFGGSGIVGVLLSPIDCHATQIIRRRTERLQSCELPRGERLGRFQKFRRYDWSLLVLLLRIFIRSRASLRRRRFRAPIVIAITIDVVDRRRAPNTRRNERTHTRKLQAEKRSRESSGFRRRRSLIGPQKLLHLRI